MKKTLVALCICAILLGHSSHGSPMPSYDTIVIGMGAAGSAAASTLAAAGKKVLALEAQDRVGGRVNTVPFGDGIVELGAEWIHGTHPSSIYDLAVKQNITVLPQDLTYKVYQSDGGSKHEAIVNDLIAFCLNVVEEPPEVPEPLGQYITRRVREYMKTNHTEIANDTDFMDNFLEFMDLVIDNYESSNSWNDVTTDTKYEELDGHQHMSWHTHGYKTLFEILLNTYKNGPGYSNLDIKLNTEVLKIEWPQNPEDSVVVTVKGGTTYTAKAVIVTVSLGVLKERYTTLFSPQLPATKETAIKTISFGLLDKVQLHFASPWWSTEENFNFLWNSERKALVTVEDRWSSQINLLSYPMGEKHVVTVWFSGDRAKHTTLFSPPLPHKKVEPIDKLSIGVVDKIVFLFNDVHWPKDGVFFSFLWRSSDKAKVPANDWWTTKIFAASCPMGNKKVLTVWTSGDGARLVETLPEDVVKTKVMEVIRRFMGAGKTIPEPIGMLRSTWYSNPFTRGSYTYDNLLTPQHLTARSDLAEPLTDSAGQPRVLFAGEATDNTHFSTVHGALDSGRREASRLLRTQSKM